MAPKQTMHSRLVREAKQARLVNPDFDISQFEREAEGEADPGDN